MKMRTLILPLLFAATLSAQETTTTQKTDTTATTTTASAEKTAAPGDTAGDVPENEGVSTSEQTRAEFDRVLRSLPPQLGTILYLDPTLLSDESFLARTPELQKFVTEHPEVRHHPGYYLSDYQLPTYHRNVFDDILEAVSIGFVFALLAFAGSWVIRTVIEQRRWNRLSRQQAEVHNKILDRFSSSDELLQYIKTPAGSKFLESAPIPLHSEPTPHNAPLTRVMWSVQIGVVVAAAAVGLIIVSTRFAGETTQGLFAIGMIALMVGVGFIASAAVSLFLSRRLGLWQAPEADNTAPRIDR